MSPTVVCILVMRVSCSRVFVASHKQIKDMVVKSVSTHTHVVVHSTYKDLHCTYTVTTPGTHCRDLKKVVILHVEQLYILPGVD